MPLKKENFLRKEERVGREWEIHKEWVSKRIRMTDSGDSG